MPYIESPTHYTDMLHASSALSWSFYTHRVVPTNYDLSPKTNKSHRNIVDFKYNRLN